MLSHIVSTHCRMGVLTVSLFAFSTLGGRAAVLTTPQVIYETGPYNHGLWPSDFSAPSSLGPIGQFADTFTIGTRSIVSSISFWGVYFEAPFGSLPDDDFVLRFYETSVGEPTVSATYSVPLLNVSRLTYLPGVPDESVPVYSYTADFSPVNLEAGTYGISMVNNLVGDPLYWRVGLSMDLSGDAFTRSTDGEDWTPVGGELGFTLVGQTIPEPGTSVLLLIGIYVVGRRRRNMRSRSSS